MTTRYDAVAGAHLLGVSASTIRSWVNRGHLPPGRYERGVLTWTGTQLKRAQSDLHRDIYVPAERPESNAKCGCGHTANVTFGVGTLTVSCFQCKTEFTIDRKMAPGMSALGGIDLNETAVDPEELHRGGAVYRLTAIVAHLKAFATGPQVYFIRVGPYVKIGTTTNVPKRLTALSLNMRHLAATIDGDRTVEKQHHKQFLHLHAFGEWFYLRDDLLEYVINRQREQIAQITEHLRAMAT